MESHWVYNHTWGRPHTQDNIKQTQWYFCRSFISLHLMLRIFCLIHLLLFYLDFCFCGYVFSCVVVCFIICLKKSERKEHKFGWVGKGGGSEKNWGRRKT